MKKYLSCFFILTLLAGICLFPSCAKNHAEQTTGNYPPLQLNTETTNLPSSKDFKAVKRGMTGQEVTALVGEPLASGGSGMITWYFILSDGTSRSVLFVGERDGTLRVTQIITHKSTK